MESYPPPPAPCYPDPLPTQEPADHDRHLRRVGAVVLSGGVNDPSGGSAGFRGKMRVKLPSSRNEGLFRHTGTGGCSVRVPVSRLGSMNQCGGRGRGMVKTMSETAREARRSAQSNRAGRGARSSTPTIRHTVWHHVLPVHTIFNPTARTVRRFWCVHSSPRLTFVIPASGGNPSCCGTEGEGVRCGAATSVR